MFHLDCTYKIIKYNFPLLIFGCTDIRRKFRPIAFAFISHEQEEDFTHFFTNLNKVAEALRMYILTFHRESV